MNHEVTCRDITTEEVQPDVGDLEQTIFVDNSKGFFPTVICHDLLIRPSLPRCDPHPEALDEPDSLRSDQL